MAERRRSTESSRHVRLDLHEAQVELLLATLNHVLDHFSPTMRQTDAFNDLLALQELVLDAHTRLFEPMPRTGARSS